jgi:hypothetical protein
VIKAALPDSDVSPEQAALDGVRQRIEQLNAMQPIIAALADTRARLAEEQRKRLGRALGSLLKNSMQFSALRQCRLRIPTRHGSRCRSCPSTPRCTEKRGKRQPRSPAERSRPKTPWPINRIGLLPALRRDGEASAPGINPRVDLNFANAPQQLRSLQAEIRRLTALLLASLPEAQESGNGTDLPQVAIEAKAAPTAAPEAPTASVTEEAA